jgi:hypothetical protein
VLTVATGGLRGRRTLGLPTQRPDPGRRRRRAAGVASASGIGAVGTKNVVPLTAVEKSSRRSYAPGGSPAPGLPKVMLSRRIVSSPPGGSAIVAGNLCDLRGAASSSISTLSILVRPMIAPCSSVASAFQAPRSCRYFWTTT